MNRILSQRAASFAVARQVEASLKADAAAALVDHVFAKHWKTFVQTLARSRSLPQVHVLASRHFASLLPLAKLTVKKSLTRIAQWGANTTRRSLLKTIPLVYLKEVAAKRVGVLESVELLEARRTTTRPGIIELVLQALDIGSPTLDNDFGIYTREPVEEGLSDEEKRDAFQSLLFPPPSRQLIDEILYQPVAGITWEQRLENATRTSATPKQLTNIVGQAYAQGKTVAEIAKKLLPAVDGVRSTARRIARTEALRVTHGVQMKIWEEGMGDSIIGYQIHAVLDEVTRPDHAHRNGTIYYRHPKRGQKGLDQMPHPPLEADGSIAWNCRCTVSPIYTPMPHMLTPEFQTLFANASGNLISDPATYDRWFENSDERRRRLAVGTRRYTLLKDKLGEDPSWSAFIDPTTGKLVPIDDLKKETSRQRTARMNRVAQSIAEHRELLRKAALLLPV